MTGVDWLIVLFTVLLALRGYSRGFLVAALSLAGFTLGALIGTRLGPLLLPQGAHSRYAPIFGLAGALLLGGLIASGFEGFGRAARTVLRIPGFRLLDGLLGAVLTACIGLGLSWILGAVVIQASSSEALRHDIQRSAILAELNSVLPPSGPILNALARFDPLPSVAGPEANVPAPTRGVLATPGVKRAVGSVVRILGSACGLGIEGTGWVVGHDLLVTNAHVVAGETDTVVQVGGHGPSLAASPVVFDPHNDIAILRVPGLGLRSLTLAGNPRVGSAAGILGYPLDGPFDEQPGRLGQTQLTSTEDAYGRGPVMREISSLRGLVRPGNSGGPMVDADGQVIATIFAAITDTPPAKAGGFAVPNSVVRTEVALAHRRRGTVSSGSCAD
jgi:S1-C subfamily serine protease